MVVCEGVRQISFVNQLIKTQFDTILDIKNSFLKVFQYIVNKENYSNSKKIKNFNSGPQYASILSL